MLGLLGVWFRGVILRSEGARWCSRWIGGGLSGVRLASREGVLTTYGFGYWMGCGSRGMVVVVGRWCFIDDDRDRMAVGMFSEMQLVDEQ